MSDNLRILGPALARTSSPTPQASTANPSVRFAHHAEQPQAVRRVGQDKDNKRPMSWAFDNKAFAVIHRKPVPSAPASQTNAHKTRRNSLESRSTAPAAAQTPAPNMVDKLAFEAGPYAPPQEKHFFGKSILTSEHRLFINTMRNQAIFLAEQNNSLEARLKTAEESIKNYERHTATFDRTLRSAQEESLFYQDFYNTYVHNIDKLTALFEESKWAATKSRKAAVEGLDLINHFARLPGHDDDSLRSIASNSNSDKSSVRGTFGHLDVD